MDIQHNTVRILHRAGKKTTKQKAKQQVTFQRRTRAPQAGGAGTPPQGGYRSRTAQRKKQGSVLQLLPGAKGRRISEAYLRPTVPKQMHQNPEIQDDLPSGGHTTIANWDFISTIDLRRLPTHPDKSDTSVC